MTVLFHQNMRVFGGGSNPRNLAYQGAFNAINGVVIIPADDVVVGFTEVTNCAQAFTTLFTGGAAPALPGALAGSLTGAGAAGFTAYCGVTAVGGASEYVGISVPAALIANVTDIGRLLITGGGGAPYTFWNDVYAGGGNNPLPAFPAFPAAFTNWCRRVQKRPFGLLADQRGIVYVVFNAGGPGGAGFIAGFVHNMFSAALPSGLLQILPTAYIELSRTFPTININNIFIGGDFNALPLDRRAGGQQIYYHASSTLAPPVPVPPPAQPQQYLTAAQVALPAIPAGGTTQGGNTYDYWFSANPRAAPLPAWPAVDATTVSTETLDNDNTFPNGLSDHVACFSRVA